MKIEYDSKKRRATFETRGLDFEDVPIVFAGLRRITWQDNRRDYGESGEITMGELAGRLVVIVHTKRSDATRIISMRKANEREQHWFEKQFAEGSMKPKIESAINFLKSGGKKVVITSPEKFARNGTVIVK